MTNPYTLNFGKDPLEFVSRPKEADDIINTFRMERPSTQVYLLTGVRGAGKTVALTVVSTYFSEQDDWIVLNLSPDTDILQSAVAKLTNADFLKKYIPELKISFKGFGLSVSKKDENADADTVLRNILSHLKKKGKRVLFVIDEVVRNDYVKLFASCFQIYMRENYPVFLLMAGTYENISDLQNENTLTFLYRAPKIALEPLSLPGVAQNYQKTLQLPIEEAIEKAKITKGYAYAFQVLGYLLWDGKDKDESEILQEFDNYLSSYVYDKIWSELSPKDREVLTVISNGFTKVADIRDQLGISPQLMNVYRKRLSDRGMIFTYDRGKMTLALPRFEVYVKIYGAIELW